MWDEQAALEWLYGFTDWERGIGWGKQSSPDVSWNLARTRWLLDALGAPDAELPVVLIAGTKGKGSTAAMVERIARAAGARTMLYSQPHLEYFRERIRLDGAPISSDAFAHLVEGGLEPIERLIREQPDAGEPTTYEITTALALVAAARHQADLAVVEVGLGGRLDATNCLSPAISVVTRISYDHTQILGRTLGAIASEKVAIGRAGRPLVSAPQRPAARTAIIAGARALGARLRFATPVERRDAAGGAQRVLGMYHGAPFESELALAGEHQRENAGLALAVCEALTEDGMLPISAEAVMEGLANVSWPGRLELIPGTPPIVLDGAHNGESAERLARALREAFSYERLILILGILRDKDARAMVRALAPQATRVITTRSQSPRALAPEELGRLARRFASHVSVVAHVSQAIAEARREASPGDLICITGSLTIVGEARALLRGS